jgi:hypothetical protein
MEKCNVILERTENGVNHLNPALKLGLGIDKNHNVRIICHVLIPDHLEVIQLSHHERDHIHYFSIHHMMYDIPEFVCNLAFVPTLWKDCDLDYFFNHNMIMS